MLSAGVLAPVAAIALLGAAPLQAGLDLPSLGDPLAGRLVGRVHAGEAALPAARVYVYDVADRSKRRTTTDRFGRYAFQPLPAGVYRVIAHRPGFVPAVAELVRTTGESVQALDFELGARERRPAGEETGAGEDDFWSVRERIPNDILRQIQIAEAIADDQGWALESAVQRERFEAELRTLSGIEDAGGDAGARVLGSQFDLRSRFGKTQLALRSDLREFERQVFNEDHQQLGDSQAFALDVNHRGSNVQITSQRHRFHGGEFHGGGAAAWDDWGPAPFAGLESYGLRVEQAAGAGDAHFEARYTADQNFHHGFGDLYAGQSNLHSLALSSIDSPMSSTTLEFQGGYERQITANASLEAGLSYREQQAYGTGRFSAWGEDPHQRFDVFSQGNWEVQPTVVLEYGMFSTLSDGNVSFTPRAGFVVELGSNWMAAVSASERVDSEHLLFRDFLQVQYHDDDACTATFEHCYRIELSRRLGATDDSRRVEFGITERQFADSVRLYFSRDIFERLESLLLLDGDQVAELHFGLQQRLGEKILTRISTSAASGGGGPAPRRRRQRQQPREPGPLRDRQCRHPVRTQFNRRPARLPPGGPGTVAHRRGRPVPGRRPELRALRRAPAASADAGTALGHRHRHPELGPAARDAAQPRASPDRLQPRSGSVAPPGRRRPSPSASRTGLRLRWVRGSSDPLPPQAAPSGIEALEPIQETVPEPTD